MSQKFAPIALDAQLGNMPDPEVVRPLAVEMREAGELWKVTLARMRLAEDFQGLEFYKLTEAQIERKGMSMQLVQDLMAWQLDGMVAFCEGRDPPPPPAGASPEILASMQDTSPSALSQMLGADSTLTAMPFDPNSRTMQTEVVRDEFAKLKLDHEQLIKMGEGYGSFDAAGKEMFLDQVEAIESRWEVFVSRFQLLGELNPEYVRQAKQYLQQVNLAPADFRQLIKEAHDLMRRDIALERQQR